VGSISSATEPRCVHDFRRRRWSSSLEVVRNNIFLPLFPGEKIGSKVNLKRMFLGYLLSILYRQLLSYCNIETVYVILYLF